MNNHVLVSTYHDYMGDRFEENLSEYYWVETKLVRSSLDGIKLLWRTMLYKWDKFIIINTSLNHLFLIPAMIQKLKGCEIIHFPYDITNFYEPLTWKKKIDMVLEKPLMMLADKIIHKGLKNELQELSFYNKIRDKPSYLFREFLSRKYLEDQESERNRQDNTDFINCNVNSNDNLHDIFKDVRWL
jgi:hypothetical protein